MDGKAATAWGQLSAAGSGTKGGLQVSIPWPAPSGEAPAAETGLVADGKDGPLFPWSPEIVVCLG